MKALTVGPIFVACVGGVLATIAGVILGLAGLAVSLMGLLAITEGYVRRGATSLLAGLLCLAGGLWLVGLLG